MGKKKIKHLGKKRYIKSKVTFKSVSIIIGVAISIITFFNINKYMEDMYKGKNITDSVTQFYVDIADEVSKGKAQVSWSELLVIDMVRYDEDLTNIKKKDVIDTAEKFIEKVKCNGSTKYKVKKFDDIIAVIGFNKEEKDLASKYMKNLKYASLGGAKISSQKQKMDFINKVAVISKETYEENGILPSVTVAQAILESGWGESYLSKNSNNLFGIKADKRWDGETIEVVTSENYDDKIVDSFRKYNSVKDSIIDHGKFLTNNERYEKYGVFRATHYTEQAQALEDAGYATKKDENGQLIYADMLIDVIRNYNLQLLDREVQSIK